jgi:hypothetical protein
MTKKAENAEGRPEGRPRRTTEVSTGSRPEAASSTETVQDQEASSNGTAIEVRGAGDAIQRMKDAEAGGGYNVLWPATRIDPDAVEDLRRLYVATVSEVRMPTTPEAGFIYHDPRYARREDGKAALTARGLNKLATAAGVEWDLDRTGVQGEPQYRPGGHVIIRYRAVGRVRTPQGGWHEEVGERLLNTEAIEEELVARKLKNDPKITTEEEAKRAVRLELAQIKERALERAETQAKNRVLRRLFNVPQVFTREELVKPFLVPLLLYRPALEAGDEGRAASRLYGSEGVGPKETAPSDQAGSPPAEAASDSEEPAANAPPAESTVEPHEFAGLDEDPCGQCGRSIDDPVHAAPDDEEELVEGEVVEESAKSEAPQEPSEDPMVQEGPFINYRFSALSKNARGLEWLESQEAQKGPVYRRKLAQAWAAYGKATAR